ncbi:YsnF/AvaK domain-containing protein [Desulfosporosinus sp.]|uniref:YsnF/AvaK domain-containing protein n=1 Tax=Desulfosporosinus sp. TaxID=157907 RepID=UPI0025BC3A83|nr:YsnF/AvaK domain-containing protein [Desulfosporosinus sp.]MBC2724727.1 YsnF/AvaK domain-containing protein [Desulfosporosinus sp.]MBC2728491.1 YsnF/AvaK domain-containing protein [Desulfosporosinus sp.]
MGILSDIFGNGNEDEAPEEIREEPTQTNDDAKLLLRKEELNIEKDRVQTGEVELSKEIIEEQRSVDVPVMREEVVIERRALNNEQTDSPIADEDAIRIPVSQEKVIVDKYTVVTGEILARKNIVEDTKHIDETLRHEEGRVNKYGNPDVIESVTDQQLQ